MHPALRHAANGRMGVFSVAEARSAGYGPDEIRALRSSGRWVRLRQGVYTTAEDLAVTERDGVRHAVECLAVLTSLARPTAVASHASAARVWGWPVPRREPGTVRLTDPHQWRRTADYRMACAPVPPQHRAHRGPVPLTSPARTLVDCGREWSLEDAVIAMDAGLLAGQTTSSELQDTLALARHWPGTPRAVRAVALADGRAESPLETRGRLRVVGAGLPVFQPQVEIWSDGRLLAVVDGWYDDAAIALEFDGKLKYTDPWRGRTPGQVLWEEKRREDALRSLDVRVVRIADEDVDRGWGALDRRLRCMLGVAGPVDRRFTVVPRAIGRPRVG
ncbi:type IV toxin-antitoxin system AbiEi family antitoxin domain-containing protein [Modestobacter sp. VKM Ac-2984]|uniref:type IV toxin-antitoxin system AbiEi family antitoxin domain-containing protein n=1 Tax=Modestobacter sp. VKM Ac-2984 TaxID=3004138 RepID=UPI0022AB17CD|nr:type IV toxin-antitoxin system AbiEi family antitoxin domain-containing protein [Modestobacter sp. VKM Ac-2984]MCZ2815796.1 type IV toxin-antitoxin system AbiEi family antitoxin domain-containing protein [Modestobacter sp. VKM Ac-2984]